MARSGAGPGVGQDTGDRMELQECSVGPFQMLPCSFWNERRGHKERALEKEGGGSRGAWSSLWEELGATLGWSVLHGA